jgi:penicillin-binding protein 2
MSVIHAPRRPEVGIRQLAMLSVVGLSLFTVSVRLWYLQVVKASELADRAQAFRWNAIARLTPRGLIEDRNGILLAGVRSELVITAVPEMIKQHRDVVDRLALLTGMPASKIREKLELARWKPYLPTPIATGISIEMATRVAEASDDLPGIDVESQPTRYYPDSTNFSHVIGYVSTPNEKDLARLGKLGLPPGEYVGKVGLEYVYERELMGKPGTDSVEVDAKRRPVRVVGRDSPNPGKKLVLTLDARLQKLAMQELQRVRREVGSAGAVVALDPRNGEVLCLASNPTYDAASFLQGIGKSEYDQLSNDPAKPLFNRAIRGSYSPGSTFKVVTTLASVKAHVFDPDRVVYCPGYYEVGDRRSKCLGRHGAIRYQDALARSCNTYFSDLGVRTGPDALREQALELGLGQRSGIDLLGEGKAIVPTDDWLRAVRKLPAGEKPKWYPGDTVNLSIGQGEIAATPLQMADLMALVANAGVCYRPHLLRSVGDSSGGGLQQVPARVSYRANFDETVWKTLRDALVQVIENGTARRAQIPGVTWAGKTGSTEHSGENKKTHSWFVGFAPAENPVIAIAVLVEQSGHGGEISAPIAAKIVSSYLAGGAALFNASRASEKVR